MSTSIDTIRQFHGTRSFESRDNLVAQSRKVGQVYRALSGDEIEELVSLAISGDERGDDYLTCLACLHPESLKPHHQQMIEKEIFYPGFIYHDANESVSSRFAELLEVSDEMLRRNHLLLCMAWAGNDAVQALFAQWRDSPPKWTTDLHVPPHSYANEAGWELTSNGERRDLFFRKTLPLAKPDDVESIDPAVAIGAKTDQNCPWCKRPLVSLFDLDLTSPSLSFLGVDRSRLQVTTCDICTAYGLVYGITDKHGRTSWHSANKRPGYLPDDFEGMDMLPEGPLILSGSKRHYMESASWAGVPDGHFSQIGGLPTWVQDAEYPECLDCSQTMIFIGQISNEDFDPMMEGIFYAFFCPGCSTTATYYQQS